MTLNLTIALSDGAINALIVDIATGSTVGEGRALRQQTSPDRSDTSTWLESTQQACAIAIDAIAALELTIQDIRSVHVLGDADGGGLVALGPDDLPVHDAISGSHSDSAADAEWLVSSLPGGADAWLAATGVLPTAGSTVALLSWLHRSEPEVWAGATRFTTPSGRLLELLGGDPAIGPIDAIGTAVVDRRHTTRWRTDLLGVVDDGRDWVEALPTIISVAVPAGLLSLTTAETLGLRAATPLHVSPNRRPTT